MSAAMHPEPAPRRTAVRIVACLAVLIGAAGLGGAAGARAAAGGPAPAPVDRQGLCVTLGEVRGLAGGRLAIDAPKVRAVVVADTTQAVEMRFRYLGSTAATAPLRSGEVRQQLGLKLLAADSCNLVYVMWRLGPPGKIVVSTKTNPGQHTNAECGTRGYRNVKPLGKSRVAEVAAGSSHSLRAELAGGYLRVWADGAPAWQGMLGHEIAELEGAVGLRTDNVRLELQLLAGGGPPGPLSHLPDRQRRKCVPGAGDD